MLPNYMCDDESCRKEFSFGVPILCWGRGVSCNENVTFSLCGGAWQKFKSSNKNKAYINSVQGTVGVPVGISLLVHGQGVKILNLAEKTGCHRLL